MPALRAGLCCLSSGTWSLMGVEQSNPCVTGKCLLASPTNLESPGYSLPQEYQRIVDAVLPVLAIQGEDLITAAHQQRRAPLFRPWTRTIGFSTIGKMRKNCRTCLAGSSPQSKNEIVRTASKGWPLNIGRYWKIYEGNREILPMHIVGEGPRMNCSTK